MILSGKTVLITGGAGEIAQALLLSLIDSAAVILIMDNNKIELEKISKMAAKIETAFCDLSDPVMVEEVLQSLSQKHKRIDILINCVGKIYNAPLISVKSGSVLKHDISNWHDVMNANLNSVFYVTRCVSEIMLLQRTKGLIVSLSSICAVGNIGQGAYSAAKAAINALTVCWAKELGPLGIRVAAIAPGFINTQSMRSVMSHQAIQGIEEKTCLRRLADVEEIVDGILFIIKNDFYTGRVMQLDGGLNL